MRKRPLAVVTMAFNEATLLPVWLRHYERQVGAENCYVLDHGSDDGSTAGIRANVVRLPRVGLNERERVIAVRDFCASLFIGFDHVLYVDADEIVVPDPEIASTLPQYLQRPGLPPVLDLFGSDVRHVAGEPDIDLGRPISEQRRYMRPLSSLCKPTLISERVDWHVGFHGLLKPHRPRFRDLYLFHLAHCDDALMFARQKKRNLAAPTDIAITHHAIDPETFVAVMREEAAQLPRRTVTLRPGDNSFEATKTAFADAIARDDWIQAPELWRLPERFVGSF